MLDERRTARAVRACGTVTFELLEPQRDDHTVAKFLATKAPGPPPCEPRGRRSSGALSAAREAGVRLIDEAPRPGAHGSQVAFLHPKSMGGVLIELCQSREGNPR